jgi:hypothetical protein
LSSVRGQPIEPEYIQDELAEIIANYEYEMQIIPQTSYIGGWINCFTGSLWNGNSNIRRTIIGTSLQMMQQLTGINFIFYFGNVFFTTEVAVKSLEITGLSPCTTGYRPPSEATALAE